MSLSSVAAIPPMALALLEESLFRADSVSIWLCVKRCRARCARTCTTEAGTFIPTGPWA